MKKTIIAILLTLFVSGVALADTVYFNQYQTQIPYYRSYFNTTYGTYQNSIQNSIIYNQAGSYARVSSFASHTYNGVSTVWGSVKVSGGTITATSGGYSISFGNK